jgi:hypothetical protein
MFFLVFAAAILICLFGLCKVIAAASFWMCISYPYLNHSKENKTMKKLILSLLFMGLFAWPVFAQAQGGYPPGEPVGDPQLVDPDQTEAHPYIVVSGINVYYFYDESGSVRYYYFDIRGNRIFYAPTWRPWYIHNGARVYFSPTPFITFGGRLYYYYYHGNIIRYYYYSGARRVYAANNWRPYRSVEGRRVYYTPRVRYNRDHWVQHSPRIRTHYHPHTHRQLYRRYYQQSQRQRQRQRQRIHKQPYRRTAPKTTYKRTQKTDRRTKKNERKNRRER